MSAEIKPTGNGHYAITGELGFDTVSALYPGPFTGESGVQLDLSGVTHTDSAGLALLVQWAHDAHRRDVKIGFSNIPGQLAAMIKVAELETVFGL
ncbi:MAG: STAS domain-containing protein [Gammaproteobacteria bacterium]|nr:STAS domain-containing protein [Gammaproteobacteria bacterium]